MIFLHILISYCKFIMPKPLKWAILHRFLVIEFKGNYSYLVSFFSESYFTRLLLLTTKYVVLFLMHYNDNQFLWIYINGFFCKRSKCTRLSDIVYFFCHPSKVLFLEWSEREWVMMHSSSWDSLHFNNIPRNTTSVCGRYMYIRYHLRIFQHLPHQMVA